MFGQPIKTRKFVNRWTKCVEKKLDCTENDEHVTPTFVEINQKIFMLIILNSETRDSAPHHQGNNFEKHTEPQNVFVHKGTPRIFIHWKQDFILWKEYSTKYPKPNRYLIFSECPLVLPITVHRFIDLLKTPIGNVTNIHTNDLP